MLGLVQNWFGPRCNPIGVDFGTDCLRLAQVQWVDDDWRLIAAASTDVPSICREDPTQRTTFFSEMTRELLVHGGFRGRSVVLGLPAASMYIQHLRMTKMDEQDLKKALPWEARGKLPIDPSKAMLRHMVAGDIYADQELRHEVIVMAAKNETVDQMLTAAKKARLDVVGMNVEAMAVLDCFTQVYRRTADEQITNFFVDIGSSGTRVYLAQGRKILFARVIPIGGDQLTTVVADALKIPFHEAQAIRAKLSQPHRSAASAKTAVETAEAPAAEPVIDANLKKVQEACAGLLPRLIEELNLCRRYYEATFPTKPVDRLVFIGGEARHRGLCQQIARELGLAAQLGDPMCRMNKWCQIGMESGIDRRQAQPAWAVAIGLSMGPPSGEQNSLAEAGTSNHERA